MIFDIRKRIQMHAKLFKMVEKSHILETLNLLTSAINSTDTKEKGSTKYVFFRFGNFCTLLDGGVKQINRYIYGSHQAGG